MPSCGSMRSHQHAAENVAPAIVVGDADAGRLRGTGKLFAVGLAVRQRRQQIDAGEARERLRDGEPLRRGERIGRAAAKAKLRRAGRLRRQSAESPRNRPSASDRARRRDTIRSA